MNYVEKIKSQLAINNSFELSMRSLIATLLSGIAAYHILIIDGFTNPDGVCEGITYYTGGDWALAGCGRWAVRYMNELTCNIIMPLYVVIMYGICIWLSIVLLAKLWSFSNSAIMALSIIMFVTPVIAEQLTYTYTALMYAFACVLSALFVYLVFRCNWKAGIIGGILCVAVMLGLYQCYVGMIAVLVFMTLIVDFIECRSNKDILRSVGVCTLASLLGCLLYSKILEWDLSRRGLDNSGTRVDEFGFIEIFSAFGESTEYAYSEYFGFLRNTLMHRNILYWGLLGVLAVVTILSVYQLLRKRMYIKALLVIVLILLIPFASNIIGIIIPYNGILNYMQYQSILLIPFIFTLVLKIKEYKFYGLVQGIATLLVVVLAWTFILGANATYKCYELSYRHINSQMQIAVGRVYDLDGYTKDETPILIAGFPSDSTLRNNMDIYQYAENLYENPAFWIGMHGATKNRYLYFMNYFGIDAKEFSDDEYAAIINTPEFAEMPVWPDKNSVAMINGYAVVKFTEEPPMP